MSLKAMSDLSPVVAVCLPPQAWLAALAEQRPAIEAAGARIVIVGAEPAQEELAYVARIAEPGDDLLDAFALAEQEPGILGRVRGRGPSRSPGAFVVRGGEITRAHRNTKPAPDFVALL